MTRWRHHPDEPPSSDVLEKDFQAKVIDRAERLGWSVFHCADCRKSPRTGAGFPDLVLIRSPVILWRELKTGERDLDAGQHRWRAMLEASGQDHAVWRPEDWDAIVETLARKKVGNNP